MKKYNKKLEFFQKILEFYKRFDTLMKQNLIYISKKMSNYKIQSINYSLASNIYEKNSKLVDNFAKQANLVEDTVSVGLKNNFDLGGVETHIAKQPDILSEGDKITSNSNSRGFFDLIKEKFSAIKTSEEISSRNGDGEVNLIEMSASINEAEVALQQIVTVRDKLVSGYKEILNSAF